MIPSQTAPTTLTPSVQAAALPDSDTPYVLSYVALRQAVGYIAILLPWAVFFGANIDHWPWQTSVSAYYYTDTRNILVGSLCAISMFQLACRGYKNTRGNLDIIASWISGIFALGVAFFPTAPKCPDKTTDCLTSSQKLIGHIHVVCAVSLFLTLAGFCLYLFQLSTAANPTPRKFVRNKIFTFCGWGILASMAFVPIAGHWFEHANFIGEASALTFFGFAWLVKGQAIFKDEAPQPAVGAVAPRIPKHPRQ